VRVETTEGSSCCINEPSESWPVFEKKTVEKKKWSCRIHGVGIEDMDDGPVTLAHGQQQYLPGNTRLCNTHALPLLRAGNPWVRPVSLCRILGTSVPGALGSWGPDREVGRLGAA